MVTNQEDVFYYLTLMNENYEHPPMPQGVEQGILKGMYLLKESKAKTKLRVQLLGSGTILREVQAAAELLEKDWGVGADVRWMRIRSDAHLNGATIGTAAIDPIAFGATLSKRF